MDNNEIKNFVSLYKRGFSTYGIAKKYDTNPQSIRYWLIKNDIELRRKWTKPNYLTEKEELKLIKLYKSGYSSMKIAKEIGVSQSTIMRHLVKLDIKRRPANGPGRKNNCNDVFFENINNQKNAYWAGFIAADGCVNQPKDFRKSRLLRIDLAIKDLNQIKKIKKDIKFSGKINFHNRKGKISSCSINIVSGKLCNDLGNLNITERKSLTLKPVRNIPNKILHHFYRGYFDGDGSIGFSKDKWRGQYSITIVGTKEFLNAMGTILKKLNIKFVIKHHPRTNKNTWLLLISGNRQVLKFTNFIYKDASTFLKRKHSIYKKMLKHFRKYNLGGIITNGK
ncbi:MAG: LAGLIDADG family homing endonuclease [Nanoarchaeota archaeon]|mgnify:CR=1 FL=1